MDTPLVDRTPRRLALPFFVLAAVVMAVAFFAWQEPIAYSAATLLFGVSFAMLVVDGLRTEAIWNRTGFVDKRSAAGTFWFLAATYSVFAIVAVYWAVSGFLAQG